MPAKEGDMPIVTPHKHKCKWHSDCNYHGGILGKHKCRCGATQNSQGLWVATQENSKADKQEPHLHFCKLGPAMHAGGCICECAELGSDANSRYLDINGNELPARMYIGEY